MCAVFVVQPPEQGVKSGASAASESSGHPRHGHSSVIDLAKAEHARMKELYTGAWRMPSLLIREKDEQ